MGFKLTDFPARFVTEIDPVAIELRTQVPIRTVTSPNAREYHLARQRRVEKERLSTRRALLGRRIPALPVIVTFTRISRQLCDDDNLPTAAKAIRDEIASLYGVSDGPTGPIQWRYEQRKVKRGTFGMMVTITKVLPAVG